MLTLGQRLQLKLQAAWESIKAFPRAFASAFARAFKALLAWLKGLASDVRTGGPGVKLSLLICGAGYFACGQIAKGIIVTIIQAAIMYILPALLWPYLSKIGTLGTVKYESVFSTETLKMEVNDYDHSFKILLFSVIALIVIIVALILYLRNIRNVRRLEAVKESGGHIPTFRRDVHDLLDKRFNITLLSLPVLGVVVFTIIPLIVMILVAFTNYDKQHMVPANLFTWAGLDNFKTLFTSSITSSFGYSFMKVFGWTILWAFVATFTNYFAGILLAMFINNKRTKLKKMWRTLFIVTIAVPQFVSLLLVRNLFANTGIVNTLCAQWGVTDFLKDIGLLAPSFTYIPFLTDPAWAKTMIILINMWVGIPYLMLMVTGILMNIPADMLESAQIDGASAFQRFRHIMMPYIAFVTGPYLISSIVGNINNFNVIYLLTNDIYITKDQLLANSNAREVDLLVTWLYRLTQEKYNYKMASAIGIMIFVICAFFTLLAFRSMTKGDKEESFR